jgi:hypothetical protein
VALAASFVATHVYYASLDDPEDAVMDQSVAWMIVGALSSAWLAFFVVFLLLIKKSYIGTLFSTQTGHDFFKNKFLLGETDEKKMIVHMRNKKLWVSIRDDVKTWTLENWERWEEEKPEWFNDAFRKMVDDDMIPPSSLRRLKNGGGARRRSSLGDLFGNGARVVPMVSGRVERSGKGDGVGGSAEG